MRGRSAASARAACARLRSRSIRLPIPDIVLVSHNHYDHLQPSSLRRFQGASRSSSRRLDSGRFCGCTTLQKIDELDWWQTRRTGDGTQITAVPAQHFSARTPFDRNRTLWCGFVLRSATGDDLFRGRHRVWPTSPRSAAAARHRPGAAADRRLRAALVHAPGAHEPRGGRAAHTSIGARVSLGMHFGTFQLTDEAIDEPLLLWPALDERGIPD